MDATEKTTGTQKEVRPDWNVKATASLQGDIFEYKLKTLLATKIDIPRGGISEFSPGARLRMMKYFARIDWQAGHAPLFMTLTYPDEVPFPEHSERNLHRQHMARHLERITQCTIPAAWRMEWVDRKSGCNVGDYWPHWHWLIFGHQYISHVQVREAWQKTIGHSGYCRTEIKRVRTQKSIQRYMAKYISKEAVSLSLVCAAYHTKIGRQYGWLRKAEIPVHEQHHLEGLTFEQRRDMIAFSAERLANKSERLESSFTLFGDDANDAHKILYGEALDGD